MTGAGPNLDDGHTRTPRWARRQSDDPDTLKRHFGLAAGLTSLWIAEPTVDPVPEVVEALQARSTLGWFGYETRPDSIVESFWAWAGTRHLWDGSGLTTSVSPSVGTSIGVMINELTDPGHGVILQPPVFTDFKTLITAAGRTPVRNPLVETTDGYRLDLDDLEAKASDPRNRLLILCSPHNPVGRVWSLDELQQVAAICAGNDVFVLADEIHADLALAPHRFVPFAHAASTLELSWAALHGPIKSFGLAGVCDTLLITNPDHAERFRNRSSQFHLTRNNVFGLAAFEAAYRHGAGWLDGFLDLLSTNVELLQQRLPDTIDLVVPEGTYLAWLDLRRLGLEVAEIPGWLASEAGLALSPGHWFGREGAGYARMTIAAPPQTIERAADQLASAASRRRPVRNTRS